jgi:hypothetical protein
VTTEPRRFLAVDSDSWREAVRHARPGDTITLAEGFGIIVKGPEDQPVAGVWIEAPPIPEDDRATDGEAPRPSGESLCIAITAAGWRGATRRRGKMPDPAALAELQRLFRARDEADLVDRLLALGRIIDDHLHDGHKLVLVDEEDDYSIVDLDRPVPECEVA